MLTKLNYFLFLIICINVNAQKPQKYADYLLNTEPSNTALFWKKVKNYNNGYNNFCNVRNNNTAIYAESNIEYLTKRQQSLYTIVKIRENCTTKYTELVESIKYILDINNILPNCTIYVLPNSEINAAAFIDGNIYINSGLIESCSFEQILAAVAHEITHISLEHIGQTEYRNLKKHKNDKLLGQITGAIMTTAMAAADAYAGSVTGNTSNINSQKYENYYNAILNDFTKNSFLFHYTYSRELEYEADLMAYLYLNHLGIGGFHLISLLNKLGTKYDYNYSEKSDHPKIADRIKVLEKIEKENSSKWLTNERIMHTNLIRTIKIANDYFSKDEFLKSIEMYEKIYPIFYLSEEDLMNYAYSLIVCKQYEKSVTILNKNSKKICNKGDEAKKELNLLMSKAYLGNGNYYSAADKVSEIEKLCMPWSDEEVWVRCVKANNDINRKFYNEAMNYLGNYFNDFIKHYNIDTTTLTPKEPKAYLIGTMAYLLSKSATEETMKIKYEKIFTASGEDIPELFCK